MGFALKSKQAVFGFNNIKSSKKPVCIVLVCSTANEGSNMQKMQEYCKNNNIPHVQLKNLVLQEITGKEKLKFLGILNQSLANAIINNASV